MQKLKRAFTMIELIFVIVILGILAAVAIPRMAATRTDAVISKVSYNIMNGASEIASYALSRGQTVSNLSVMSNGISSLVNSGDAVLDVANRRATVSMGTIANCVIVQVLTTATDENLTVTFGNAGGDNRCLSLQSLIDVQEYPIKLRGQYVRCE